VNDTAIGGAQRAYARLAGFMYFANYVTAVFGTFMPARIRGSGDFSEQAQRILASEHVYRTALTSMAVSWILIVFLAFALYVTLAPVNKRVAQLALFLELGQACVGAVTVIFTFATLELYMLSQAAGPFQSEQLQALISAIADASGSGFQIAMTFLGVGSTLFFYLFYKSRYLPRPLAGLGVFGSVVMVMVSLATLVFPEYSRTLQYGWAPIGIAEVTTSFWLMIRGIRPASVHGVDVARGGHI
jgi:Domain of unknown function (DUF4386)